MNALILVDIQRDFCPGGSLAVPRGDDVVRVANKLAPHFDYVVLTQDFHPAGHSSFAAQGGPWPAHCVQGTQGAEFHPDLTVGYDVIVPKGTAMGADSYSGFADDDGTPTGLDAWLSKRHVTNLTIMGLATDYCVTATVEDALALGYAVQVVGAGCRGVDLTPGDSDRALAKLAAKGARLVGPRAAQRRARR